MRFSPGLSQTNLLLFSIQTYIWINQILSWAAPNQLTLSFHNSLHKYESDSVLCCPNIFFSCIFNSNSNWNQLYLSWAAPGQFVFSNCRWIGINQILSYTGPNQFAFTFNCNLNRNLSDSVLGCPKPKRCHYNWNSNRNLPDCCSNLGGHCSVAAWARI